MDGRRRVHERSHPCIVDASGRRARHCRSEDTVRRTPVDAPRRSDRDTVAFLFPPEYPLDSQVPFPPRPPPPDGKSLEDTVDTCRCSGAKTKSRRRTMQGGKKRLRVVSVRGKTVPRDDGRQGSSVFAWHGPVHVAKRGRPSHAVRFGGRGRMALAERCTDWKAGT